MPELVFYRQDEEVLRVGLTRHRMVIGRDASCDIVLPDPQVSHQHVALYCDGPRCELEDLSGQGTWVLGKPMKHGRLSDGAQLKLGLWTAIFRERGGAADEGPRLPGQSTDLKPVEAVESGLPPVQLRVKQGDTQFLYQLSQDSFTVGTAPSNRVVLKERFISSQHLRVTRRETGFHVQDLNSTNGTYAGEIKLHEATVPLNTVLRIGGTELIFEPEPRGPQVPSFHGLVGDSPEMRQLVDQILRVAKSGSAVTLLGESGTGKELVARALHACSSRAKRAFLPVNCAALSAGLTESELFGHEKGAFTGAVERHKGAFEEADGGTLFLDELGELPLELQAKLLRVLERGELKRVGSSRPVQVDVRVIAATNRDLPALVREGRFREDLYYRLCAIPVVLPPLRRRRADIRLLADYFLREYMPRDRMVCFTAGAMSALEQHRWRGNVRELRNVVAHALLLGKGSKIDTRDLLFEPSLELPRDAALPELERLELPEGMLLEQMMQRVERKLIQNTLRRCNYHKEQASKRLGLARSALFKRLKEWGLEQAEE